MTNSTSMNAIFVGAWFNRMATKQENCHPTAQADKEINEKMLQHTNLKIFPPWLLTSTANNQTLKQRKLLLYSVQYACRKNYILNHINKK